MTGRGVPQPSVGSSEALLPGLSPQPSRDHKASLELRCHL